MPENLEDRAQAGLTLLRALAGQVGAALATARHDLDRRHPDPSAVAPDDWAAELGATQHVATARAALSELRAEQKRIRAALATVPSPADTATYEGQLREALVADAALRVRLREGEERVAAADAQQARLATTYAVTQAAVAAADADLRVAVRRQADGEAMRAALTGAPLDTLPADATAAMGGAGATAAGNRLDELLPDGLRTRALARAVEAEALSAAAVGHERSGGTRDEQVAALAGPLQAEVDAADREFVRAEAALRRYVHTAVADLAAVEAAFAEVALLPDLTPAQQDGLDPANRADAVAAASAEQALAAAVAALDDAQRAVDDAVLDVLVADPDADPDQDAAVQAAVQNRDGAAVQDPLAAARGDYDGAARAALDAWEVEVPAELWRGAVIFAAATATGGRLADPAARDDLVTALDDAQDRLAAALDARDAQVRREVAVALALAPRAGAAAAAASAGADRRAQYVRGDGPGGRLPGQL